MIKLIVYDFDGVLTDSRVYVTEEGKESVACNRNDGWWIKQIKAKGMDQIVLTTEQNPVVLARGKKLNLQVIQSPGEKLNILKEVAREKNIGLENICYIGNEMNDFECMKSVGLTMAPADSNPKIYQLAKIKLNVNGGAGIARKVYEYFFEIIKFEKIIKNPNIYVVIPIHQNFDLKNENNIFQIEETIHYAKEAAEISKIFLMVENASLQNYENKNCSIINTSRGMDKIKSLNLMFEYCENNGILKPEIIIYLNPKTRNSNSKQLGHAIEKLLNDEVATSLCSIKKINTPIYDRYFLDDSQSPGVEILDGNFEIFRAELILKHGKLYGNNCLAFLIS